MEVVAAAEAAEQHLQKRMQMHQRQEALVNHHLRRSLALTLAAIQEPMDVENPKLALAVLVAAAGDAVVVVGELAWAFDAPFLDKGQKGISWKEQSEHSSLEPFLKKSKDKYVSNVSNR